MFLFLLIVFACSTQGAYPSVDLPDPHLIIISTVDIDSTRLANVLLGADADCNDCLTDACSNTTTTCFTKYAVGHWVDTDTNVSLIQASNFGGPGGYMIVKDTVDIMKGFVKTNNIFLILINASIHKTQDSFDTNLDPVLSQLGALFGSDFWDRVVLGATDWHYDEASINSRNATGKNEEWWTLMMTTIVKQRYDVPANISAVFIDADAKLPENVNGTLQAEYFEKESEKLISMLCNTLSMEMKILQDQNAELNNVINYTLKQIQVQVDGLVTDITQVKDNVIDNGIDVNYVKGVVALNQIDIENQGKQITEINGNVTMIFDNQEKPNFITEMTQAHGFQCIGETVVTIPGNIVSANYPDVYPGYPSIPILCTFILVPESGTSVNLEFGYFKTVNSNDYLDVTPAGGDKLTFSSTSVPPATTFGVDQTVNITFRAYNSMYDYDAIYRFSATFTIV